jgi:DNA-binding transcriptional ArsR family regulator
MKKKLLPFELYEKQAEICGALANPVRLQILDILGEQEATATELQERLDLPKSNLSQHLTVLKRAGILKARGEGRSQFLSLSIPEIKEACSLVRQVLLAQMSQNAILAKNLK